MQPRRFVGIVIIAVIALVGERASASNSSSSPGPSKDLPDAVRMQALADLSPFCKDLASATVSLPPTATECIHWEEQELDMLLMFLELSASGVQQQVASQFYDEIRCLSRSNIRFDIKNAVWEVCFEKDYSEIVGQLLGRYILSTGTGIRLQVLARPEMGRAHPDSFEDSTDDFLHLSGADTSRVLFMNFLTSNNAAQIASFSMLSTPKVDCCRACSSIQYFPNAGSTSCVQEPFGRHCCHNACKSLQHLRIGASSSTHHCCPFVYPTHCAF